MKPIQKVKKKESKIKKYIHNWIWYIKLRLVIWFYEKSAIMHRNEMESYKFWRHPILKLRAFKNMEQMFFFKSVYEYAIKKGTYKNL